MLKPDFGKYVHFSFDLDGTLVDTLSVMECAWSEVNKRTGIGVPFLHYKQFIGLPFEEILRNIGIVDGVAEIKKIYFETTASLIQEVTLFGGALELLDSLGSQSDVYVTIITSKPTENAKKILEKFDLAYLTVIGGDCTSFGKPFKDPFLQVEKVLDIPPDLRPQTIYFGDMLSDFVFTRNCGVDYCHCNYGFFGPLSKHIRTPHLSIECLQDIFA